MYAHTGGAMFCKCSDERESSSPSLHAVMAELCSQPRDQYRVGSAKVGLGCVKGEGCETKLLTSRVTNYSAQDDGTRQLTPPRLIQKLCKKSPGVRLILSRTLHLCKWTPGLSHPWMVIVSSSAAFLWSRKVWKYLSTLHRKWSITSVLQCEETRHMNKAYYSSMQAAVWPVTKPVIIVKEEGGFNTHAVHLLTAYQTHSYLWQNRGKQVNMYGHCNSWPCSLSLSLYFSRLPKI